MPTPKVKRQEITVIEVVTQGHAARATHSLQVAWKLGHGII